MADFVGNTAQRSIFGQPLIFTRADALGEAVTACAAADTWYPLLPSADAGELLARNTEATGGELLPAPDFVVTDIDLDTHTIEPVLPPGPDRMPLITYLFSNAFGGDDTGGGSRDIRVALFDVQGGLTPATGAELVWNFTFEGVDDAAANDTLTINAKAWVQRNADLRFYVQTVGDGAIANFDVHTDIRQLYFRIPIGA